MWYNLGTEAEKLAQRINDSPKYLRQWVQKLFPELEVESTFSLLLWVAFWVHIPEIFLKMFMYINYAAERFITVPLY